MKFGFSALGCLVRPLSRLSFKQAGVACEFAVELLSYELQRVWLWRILFNVGFSFALRGRQVELQYAKTHRGTVFFIQCLQIRHRR